MAAEELWETEGSGNNQQRELSSKEREYLMTGDPGSYTTAAMEERVAEKGQELPTRIQRLVDDVSLLYYDGYFREDETDDIWDNLLDISKRSQTVRDRPILRTWTEYSEPEMELGFELGSLLRMTHGEAVPPSLVWGMIIGLFGEPAGEYNQEASNLVELFNELDDRQQQRLVSAGRPDHTGDGLSEERQEAREILHQQGIAPAGPLVDEIILEHTTGETDLTPDDETKSYDPDMLISGAPSEVEIPEQPDEMPLLDDSQDQISNIIDQVIENTPIQSVDRLAKDLQEDAFQIREQGWRGVDAEAAFKTVAEGGERTHIRDFSQSGTQGQNNVTYALRQLASPTSGWINRSVVKEDGPEWLLTDYGRLLYEVRFERDCSTDWVYKAIVEPKSIEDQFKDIILSSP